MNFDNHGIIGADISFYQGYPPKFPVVDFYKMRSYGFSFVILKASQRNYVDPSFAYNVKAVKGVLPFHTYHYYDNTYNPVSQADKYWQTIKSYFQGGVAWLDLEDREDGGYRGWRYWYDFLETFMLLSGLSNLQIGIYTAYWYWREEMLKVTWAQREYFHRYPLWLANYGQDGSDPLKPDFGQIAVPNPWPDDECLIVQTGTPVIGKRAGVYSEELDYNFFNGGWKQFRRIFPSISDVTISIRSN